MSAVLGEEPRLGAATDPLTGELDDILTVLADGVAACAELRDAGAVSDRDRIERIARLEAIKAAAAAMQAAESVRFAQSQVAEQLASGVNPLIAGRGIADQIGLACRVSPWEGSRRLGIARALWFDLPETFRLLTAGRISERVASLVVSETRHLDAAARRSVDGQIVAAGLARMGVRESAACARRCAYAADPEAYVERGKTERKHRRVSLRPAPDTMSWLSGYLPVEQGVACLAALRKQAETLRAQGDPRSRDQIMADTLVERLTGQTAATDVDVEVQIVMGLDSLLDPNDPTPAEIAGFGPIPASIARQLIISSQGRKWWRRLFTAAAGGPIIGGDPFLRRFDGFLGKLITFRDRRCRNPYCDAPIRHLDHIRRHADHGPTTFENGRGVCERDNYVREMPGWKITLLDDGLHGKPHAIMITTPTGHSYTSTAPQPP
jgi:hypothetical protein